MKDRRCLIISADDFGMSEVFDQEILNLVREGCLSSVSTMVRRRLRGRSDEQLIKLRRAADQRSTSVGLHLEVEANLDLATDIRSQVDRFTELLGTEPSHVDVHVPHKLGDGILDVLEVVSELGYPTRHLGFCRAPDCVTDTPAFVATGVPNSRIAAWLDSLPPGLHEIVLHPGKMDTSCQSTLNAGRERDARLARWLAQEVDARIAFELARSDGGTRGS